MGTMNTRSYDTSQVKNPKPCAANVEEAELELQHVNNTARCLH